MKKRITQLMTLVSVFFMAAIASVQANPITAESAMHNAKAYLVSGPMKKAKGKLSLSLAYSLDNKRATTDNKNGLVYVFNISGNQGFVIASGDDMVEPILGHCEEGEFDPNNIPAPMKEWMDEYVKEIDWVQTHGYSSEPEPLMASKRKDVKALVKNKWNQGSPYNAKCKFNGTACYTGCVATAMAQVMYYWAMTSTKGKYKCGSVAYDSYYTDTKAYYVDSLPAIEAFAWGKMTTGKPKKKAAKAAVAQLMRYCGQSVYMDYTKSGSGAFIEDAAWALKYHFNYDCSLHMAYASDMTKNEWNAMIYAEIVAKRPVIMAGNGKKGGHAFICDGYRKKDKKFHFNWGWGGSCNGYFALTSLKTKYGTFNSNKAAIVGINPMENRQMAIANEDMPEIETNYKEEMTKATGKKNNTGNETTGIEQNVTETQNDNAPFYDLNGVKVENPTKGLYIRNGKKVFVK